MSSVENADSPSRANRHKRVDRRKEKALHGKHQAAGVDDVNPPRVRVSLVRDCEVRVAAEARRLPRAVASLGPPQSLGANSAARLASGQSLGLPSSSLFTSSQSAPELNSLRRVDNRIRDVCEQLQRAEWQSKRLESATSEHEIGAALAQLSIPAENLRTTASEKSAQKVNFDGDSRIFHDLSNVSVNLSELERKVTLLGKGSTAWASDRRADPVPRLHDFHRPYQGQDIPFFYATEEFIKLFHETQLERQKELMSEDAVQRMLRQSL